MLLYDFRHAECEGNREYGLPRDDSPLTRRGLVQARAAANYASGKGITAVYSSPLLRALRTAEILAEKSGCPITVLDDLAELNFEEDESHESLRARVEKAYEKITGSGNGTAAIVAHQIVNQMLVAVATGLEFRKTMELYQDHDLVYLIDSEQRTVRCELGRARKPRAYRGDFWIRKANGFLSNIAE